MATNAEYNKTSIKRVQDRAYEIKANLGRMDGEDVKGSGGKEQEMQT